MLRTFISAWLTSVILLSTTSISAAKVAVDIESKLASSLYERLLDQITQKGTTQVIVELDTNDKPMAALKGRQARKREVRRARRQAIESLQVKLLSRMSLRPGRKIKRFSNIAFLAMEVDSSELEQLRQLPGVASIKEDSLLRPTLDVSAPQIGADLAWTEGFTGTGQVIAVLDTGVDGSHPALVGKIVDEACYSTTNLLDSAFSLCPDGSQQQLGPGSAVNCTGITGCDHGTHVAGIAAGDHATYAGIGRGAELLPIQVFSRINNFLVCFPYEECLWAYTSDVVKGLERVYELRDQYDIAAVNMSLGGETYTSSAACDAAYPLMKAAIENLRSVDITTVIAAGNLYETNAISTPACISNAISVGAVDDTDEVANFSNSADWLKTLAPGVNIASTVLGSGFSSKSGTSMASPHVAGAVAVLGSAAPGATADEIEEALTSSGLPIIDWRNGVEVPRLQVDAAIDATGIGDLQLVNLLLEPLVSGLDRPVAIGNAGDGSGRLFVGLEAGRILIFDGTQMLPQPFLDLTDRVACCDGDNVGLRGFAFHPDFGNDGRLFVSYIGPSEDLTIESYPVSDDPNVATDNAEIVLSIAGPLSDHPGGDIGFGPDGYLYIAVGDGSSDGELLATAGDLDSWRGKLLRIDVDGAPPYTVPPDNPYVTDPQALPEIWASGLHNPSRFAFDRLRGDIYIADQGESQAEEINFQVGKSEGGEDYGWSVMEGSQCTNPAECDQTGLALPVAEYGRNEGCAVTGGLIYRGQAYPELRGIYFHGDICSGQIWGLTGNGITWDYGVVRDAGFPVKAFGQDEDGNLYIADHTNGDIYLLKQGPRLLTDSLPDGEIEKPYEFTLQIRGGVPPYTWTLVDGNLPTGLALESDSGIIRGTPTVIETANFTLQVEDADLNIDTRELTLQINPPPLVINTEVLPDAGVSQPYHQVLQPGGGIPPYTWILDSGALPPGINLDAGGVLSGIPPIQGVYDFEIRLTDSVGVSVQQAYTLKVVGPSGTVEIGLSIGVVETGQYGNGYGGSDHFTDLVATFESMGSDLMLSVTGYDIDWPDEVAVYLNDTVIGYLSPGPNEALNLGDSIRIPSELQVTGRNEIRFKQVGEPGWIWGVTNLLVEVVPPPPEITLQPGFAESGQYGHRYGSGDHFTALTATFTSANNALILSVTGYDIDWPDEVVVYLNDTAIGYLSPGPDNELNGGDRFYIPTAVQVDGLNEIRFKQVGEPGWIWGVTDLLLEAPPQVTLTQGNMDSGQYGHGYGSDLNDLEVKATFEFTGTDLVLHVTGYDIDHTDEIGVYLNDARIGYLSVGPDNGVNAGDDYLIPSGLQVSGENHVTFRQDGQAGWIWGVTDLLIDAYTPPAYPADITLTPGAMNGGKYGHNYGASQNYTELVTAFIGTGDDLDITVNGYDVDYEDEIGVYLNGSKLGFLSAGPNNGLNAGNTFIIPAGIQVGGENRLVFRQNLQPGWKWGVTNLLLDFYTPPNNPVDTTLSIGETDYGAYGHNYGSSQNYAEFEAAFEGTGNYLAISVTGYDVDHADEIGVYLNGSKLGFLSAGPDNGLNAGDTFVVPAGIQVNGENRLVFRQEGQLGWKWGVTNLLIDLY